MAQRVRPLLVPVFGVAFAVLILWAVTVYVFKVATGFAALGWAVCALAAMVIVNWRRVRGPEIVVGDDAEGG